MNRLLKVTGRRLLRDKVFYPALIVTLLLALYITYDNAPTMAEWAAAGDEWALENCFFNLTPILGLIFGAFVSLFLGVEYSDGTLRNKLIAGHSRSAVFLSMFVVSALSCLAIAVMWLIGSLPGLLYFDGFGFGWNMFLLYTANIFCCAVFFAAIYTTISMLIPNKAVSAVVALLLWFALLFLGSAFFNTLAAPEMTTDYILDGMNWVETEPYPNPAYISGVKRTILEALCVINPVCPAIQMADASMEQPLLSLLHTLTSTVILLFVGCALFRKKDLK